ncbi:MAG: hypothetical protein WCI74_10060 [Actinomycetes bacterium]
MGHSNDRPGARPHVQRSKTLLGFAVAAALIVLAAGIAYGYWRVSRSCPQWADEQGATVIRNDWWAKTNSCTVTLANGARQSHDIGVGERLATTAVAVSIWLGGAFLIAIALLLLARVRNWSRSE